MKGVKLGGRVQMLLSEDIDTAQEGAKGMICHGEAKGVVFKGD